MQREYLSICYSSNEKVHFIDEEKLNTYELYQWFMEQHKKYAGKWQFSSEERSVVLEFKEGGNIEYYVSVNNNSLLKI